MLHITFEVVLTTGMIGGWTALHWAIRNNDLPIVSYLLNHRASPSIMSNSGLKPGDLVKGDTMRDVISIAMDALQERDSLEERRARDNSPFQDGSVQEGDEPFSPFPPSSLAAHPTSENEEEEGVIDEERQRRIELAIKSAENLGVDLDSLGLDSSRRKDVRSLLRSYDQRRLLICNNLIRNREMKKAQMRARNLNGIECSSSPVTTYQLYLMSL